MRLVLDTNIVIDMLYFDDPRARPLQTALDAGEIMNFTDSDCLAELGRVICYTQFKLDSIARDALIDSYRKRSVLCDATSTENYPLPRCEDDDDQKFLLLATRCKANLLITRDRALLKLAGSQHKPLPCPIVTADVACQLLRLTPKHPSSFV